MAYTDYQFYTTKYFGDAVTEEEFPKYAERASERVDSITFDRLADGPSGGRKSSTQRFKRLSVRSQKYCIRLTQSEKHQWIRSEW